MNNNIESVLQRAFSIAKNLRHSYICLDHLLLSLLDEKEISSLLIKSNVNVVLLRQKISDFLESPEMSSIVSNSRLDIQPTIAVQNIINRLHNFGIRGQESNIIGGNNNDDDDDDISLPLTYLFLEIIFQDECHSIGFIKEQEFNFMKQIYKLLSNVEFIEGVEGRNSNSNISINTDYHLIDSSTAKKKDNLSILNEYCVNLNQKATKGKIDKVLCREDEIERTIDILMRRNKNNPLYVGDPGVGKTAIAEGLALKIVQKTIPDLLKDIVIYSLDVGSLIAGTRYRGDFEERIKSLIKEISNNKNIVLFIDEIHTIVGAGATSNGTIDAGNLLKPVLSRGEIRCIGATTHKEYVNNFDKDPALSRRFQRIDIEESSIDDTMKILRGIKVYYENYHKVVYSDHSIREIVNLSKRYINNKMLPDKAIDLMDEAGSYFNVRRNNNKFNKSKFINTTDIKKVVSLCSKIPNNELSKNFSTVMEDLEKSLRGEIYGQDQVINKLLDHIFVSGSGLIERKKPKGCYMFIGPTGVGKTEIAKILSKHLFMKFLRFDMSEYSESHSISRMIGSPPGYVGFESGGMLTDAVNRYPYSIVLFDEMEKAHKDVYNILLQIMDYGYLTDTNSRKVNFRNTIIILTTNTGSNNFSEDNIGFDKDKDSDSCYNKNDIKNLFLPEFLSRIDLQLFFNPITKDVRKDIVLKLLNNISDSVGNKSLKIYFDDNIVQYIIDKGFHDNKYGVRNVQRFIEQNILIDLAKKLIKENKKISNISVNMDVNEKLHFNL
ncbi:AAA domain-containing protein [Anaplasmataceae bacterium AB001_6]|nr:AAA domain-containing protein [Anaplasmataceae bacterium AB001_6]